MAKVKTASSTSHTPMVKKTSQSDVRSSCKRSSLNKHKKRSLKFYRGQGR